jgi:hypothetical protein
MRRRRKRLPRRVVLRLQVRPRAPPPAPPRAPPRHLAGKLFLTLELPRDLAGELCAGEDKKRNPRLEPLPRGEEDRILAT